MNLIDDKWIPVKTRSGGDRRIAPWQITEGLRDDPIVMVAPPRPDFAGALLEMLIGLLQVEAAPADMVGWDAWKRDPPSPEELRRSLARVSAYFNLDGEGPRFLQSFEPFEGKEKPIAELIVDTPSSEAMKKNTDHFIKRGGISGLCPACTATALFAVNACSPAAGRNHRTSLRGGGPVTTLVVADPEREPEHDTLWHLLWLNVLPRDYFEGSVRGNQDATGEASVYAWLAPTRTSEKGEVTTPLDMSAYHVFWGMPRRIRLDETTRAEEVCDICRRRALLFTRFSVRHGGMNYDGGWVHPLTPHSVAEDGAPDAFRMRRGGLGYRNWGALVTGERREKWRREPAICVRHGLSNRRKVRGRSRLLAFGYDVDNAKIRGWYEYRTPVYAAEQEQTGLLREIVTAMITGAEEVAANLRSALRTAWAVERSPEFAVAAFWQHTEARFLELVDLVVPRLGDPQAEDHALHQWHRTLCGAAEELFETWVETDTTHQADPGRIATAQLALRRWNWKKPIRDALRLPENVGPAKGGTP